MDNHYSTIRDIISGQGSRICSVEFIKKDGSYRKMLVQSAVLPTRLKGDAASESAKKATETRRTNHPHLYNVWCMDNNAPRSINMDTVLRISGSGVVLYEVVGAGEKIYQARHQDNQEVA